jgi:HPt (histidine-containing phosphotransfer) domain-containing protein
VGGSPEVVDEILNLARKELPPMLAAVREACAGGDPKQIAKSAHALRSVVGNIGDRRAHQAVASLEKSGRDGDLPSVSAGLACLEAEVTRLLAALEAHRDRSSPDASDAEDSLAA